MSCLLEYTLKSGRKYIFWSELKTPRCIEKSSSANEILIRTW